ncbi:hypothetical protein [Plebeiibacterium sediminum]|uniref:Uncharacterized protein n=1 Tax=Plebeiibacterium sediminum TaxID=2992112 RepID=A0AAE3M497_9BACT|nr:hypothetical protein [Plebeiobacterium sediminum]MCW3786859.1 hypothetical protein [Plebeiobacterium sediminum]
MTDKFKNVLLDEDTKIIKQKECKVGDIDVLYQKWIWDGVLGESIIFAEEDVRDYNEQEIKQLVLDSEFINSKDVKMTFNRGGKGFVFVNFGFEYC